MGYKDILIKSISFTENATMIISTVRGITENHVMLTDSFPEALDGIKWETSNNYLYISAESREIDGEIVENPEFGYAATITCILGIPDD